MQSLTNEEKQIYIPDIPKEGQAIIKIINKFGAVYDTQLRTLLRIRHQEEIESFNYCLTDILMRNDRILFDDEDSHGNRKIYPLSFFGNVPGPDVPECLWNVCAMMRARKIDTADAVQLAENPGCLFYPEAVTNIEEDNDGNTVERASHEIITDVYIDEDNLWKVPYLQERYFARVSKREDGTTRGHTNLNLVVNSMTVAEQVLDMYAISIPMRITCVDYRHKDAGGMPKVTRHTVD